MRHKLLLLLLLLIPVVSAEIIVVKYSVDRPFSITAQQAGFNLCKGQTVTDTIRIQNLANQPQNFQISTNQPDRVTGIQRITTSAGETVQVPLSIQASDVTTDTYTVFVTNQDGASQKIERDLTIQRCQTIQASLFRQTEQQINPCQPIDYTLQLTNPSTTPEQYLIEGQTNQTITLQPKTTETLNATYQFACSLYGTAHPTFNITAQQSQLQATLQDTVEINRSYPYTITQNTAQEQVCVDEQAQETYTLQNNAPFENTYTLTTLGDGTVSTQNLTVPGQANKTFTVMHEHGFTGERSYTVTATSERGSITEQISHEYSVEDCYDIALSTQTTYCTDEGILPVTVTNNGVFTETVTVNANTDIENVSFEPVETVVEPGSSQDLVLPVTTEFTGRSLGRVDVTGTYETRTDTVTQTQSQELRVHDAWECRKTVYPLEISAQFRTNTVDIPVTNTGMREATYDITIESDTFSLNQDEITIGPGQTQTVTLTHSQNTSQTLNPTLTFETGRHSYVYEPTVSLTDIPWYTALFEFIIKTPCAILSTILIICIIASLVVSRFTPIPRFVWAPILLSLVVLIGILILYGVPPVLWPAEQVDITENAIEVVLDAGQETRIDVSEYFTDPDQDMLRYDLQNTSGTLEGPVFIYQAPYNEQYEEGTLTATDEDNATASVPVSVYVRPPRPTTAEGWYLQHCPHINGLLIILLILTVFAYRKKPEMERPTSRNTKAEIKQWLDAHGVDYTDNMTKQELLDLLDKT